MMTNKWKKIIYGFFLVSCISVSFVSTSITSQASNRTVIEITINSGSTPTTTPAESSSETNSSLNSSSVEKLVNKSQQQLPKTNETFSWELTGLGIILLLSVFYIWRKKEI